MHTFVGVSLRLEGNLVLVVVYILSMKIVVIIVVIMTNINLTYSTLKFSYCCCGLKKH